MEENDWEKIIKDWEKIFRHAKESVEIYSDVFARMDVKKMKINIPEDMTKNLREAAAKLGDALKPIVERLDDIWKGWPGINNKRGETR